MSMTRKDYVAIADAIARTETNSQGTVARVAQNIADVLAADNPRFDRERFLTAAGVPSSLFD